MTFRTGNHRKDAAASLLGRLVFLVFAVFAIVHLPLGHSEPSRPSQYFSDWPKTRIRSSDLPVYYSVQQHGRTAMVQAANPGQQERMFGDARKAVASSRTGELPPPTIGRPKPSLEPDEILLRHAAVFLARAPPARG